MVKKVKNDLLKKVGLNSWLKNVKWINMSNKIRQWVPELQRNNIMHHTYDFVDSYKEVNFDWFLFISKIPSCEPELYASKWYASGR